MLLSLFSPTKRINKNLLFGLGKKPLFLTTFLLFISFGDGFPSRMIGPWNISAHKNETSGGLTWIFQQDDASAISCIILIIRGGKGAVPPGQSGLAYLTTRLAVEIPDTDKARDLMSQSTRLAAGCREEYSFINIQCLSENLDAALKTVLKIIKNPLLSGLRIDSVKDYMLHLSKIEQDNAAHIGHAEALASFLDPESFGSPVHGTEESLRAIQKKDITQFYENRFTASNMILCVVSDLEESVLSGAIEKYFGGFKAGGSGEAESAVLVVPRTRKVFKPKDTHQSYLCFVFALSSLSPRNYALAYLAKTALGGGVGSKTWPLRFRDKLAYNVNSSISCVRGGVIIEVYMETSPGKLAHARESLQGVIGELADNGLTEEDLQIIRNNARASFLRSNETKEARAMAFGEFESNGLGYDFLERFPDELQSVTAGEMNLFLKNVLSLESAVEIVIGPEKEPS